MNPSRFRWLLALMLSVAPYASACSRQPSEIVYLPPVGMDVSGPYIADRSGALAFWGNGSLQLPVELGSGPVVITVTARGNTVDGQAPQLRIALDGKEIGRIDVDSNVLRVYTAPTAVEIPGKKTLRLSFDNYLRKTPPLGSRHLFIEMITLQEAG